MKSFFSLLLFCFIMGHATPPVEPTLSINNAILAKVNDKSISVLDVVKKMDMLFYSNYPDLAESEAAKYKFYQVGWKRVLDEMINSELMIADSEDKELKLSDGEVREEMESRFGPNVLMTLNEMNLSYDEAFTIVKNEMIVQRMSWYYAHSKALQNVTPQMIRNSYANYCQENPPKEEWVYQIITLDPSSEEEEQKFFQLCQNKEFTLDDLQKDSDSITTSSPYSVSPKDLSESYYQFLEPLAEGEYSEPVTHIRRTDKKKVWRVFYVEKKEQEETPNFHNLYQKLSNQLLEEKASLYLEEYVQKLRKQYHFSEEKIVDHFEPFSIQ